MATRRIVKLMLESTIEQSCGSSRAAAALAARTKALAVLEINGLRVGEASGGGGLHGLLANANHP